MTTDLRIIETCACGASINVVGSKYRSDGDTRNPRGAEEVVERWREDHKHITAALGLAVDQEEEEKMVTPAEVIATVIETHKDSIGTHYPECWKYHAGCLALLLRDLWGAK